MTTKSSKKPLIIGGIIAVVVVIAVVVGIIMANKNSGGSGAADTNASSSENNGNKNAAVTADELKGAADFTISYGDYDGMFTLSKSIQNGELTGKIVKIDGLVSHPGMSYSVVQSNSDGTQKFGTVFKIIDTSETNYPEDGARITITAKVVEVEPLVYYLYTLKDFVKEK